MTHRNNSFSLFNPFLAWSDLAIKAGEMMLESSQVIHHRTGRMATAGVNPSMHDQREFALMGQEKMEAMMESAQAMALQMMMHPGAGLYAVDWIMKSSAAILALASSTSIEQSVRRQGKLARVMAESANIHTDFSESAAKIAHSGMKPLHSRVTANAKRLEKS